MHSIPVPRATRKMANRDHPSVSSKTADDHSVEVSDDRSAIRFCFGCVFISSANAKSAARIYRRLFAVA